SLLIATAGSGKRKKEIVCLKQNSKPFGPKQNCSKKQKNVPVKPFSLKPPLRLSQRPLDMPHGGISKRKWKKRNGYPFHSREVTGTLGTIRTKRQESTLKRPEDFYFLLKSIFLSVKIPIWKTLVSPTMTLIF